MYDFRVAKCLSDDGERIDDYAIFKDGSPKRPIYTTEDGHQYFYVKNELNMEEEDTVLKRSFNGRIKDAIETIRAGKGHAIVQKKALFSGNFITNVVYFVDEEVGKEFREKTLEGWKNTQFCYIIKVGFKNSFNDYVVNKKREHITMFDEGDNRIPMRFDTYQEADQYMKDLIKETEQECQEIIDKINNGGDDEERENIFNMLFDKYDDKISALDIKLEIFYDMIQERGGRKYIFYLRKPEDREYTYRIIQDVVRDPVETKEE